MIRELFTSTTYIFGLVKEEACLVHFILAVTKLVDSYRTSYIIYLFLLNCATISLVSSGIDPSFSPVPGRYLGSHTSSFYLSIYNVGKFH